MWCLKNVISGDGDWMMRTLRSFVIVWGAVDQADPWDNLEREAQVHTRTHTTHIRYQWACPQTEAFLGLQRRLGVECNELGIVVTACDPST